VSIYTLSQLTELGMNVWSCKTIQLRTPSLQIMKLHCKMAAHSHFDKIQVLRDKKPCQSYKITGISIELVVPIVKFWKAHFLHFLNPEDGWTKPLRSVTFYRSIWLHNP
jgi:hypothetical protein